MCCRKTEISYTAFGELSLGDLYTFYKEKTMTLRSRVKELEETVKHLSKRLDDTLMNFDKYRQQSECSHRKAVFKVFFGDNFLNFRTYHKKICDECGKVLVTFKTEREYNEAIIEYYTQQNQALQAPVNETE
jgi:hypothetical protein